MNNRAFTLVETLIAMSIMMGAIVVVANTWSGNFSRVKKMRLNTQASYLLERLIEDTKFKYQNDINSVPEEETGEFEDNKEFSWEITSQKMEMPDLSSLLISSEGTDELTLTMVKQMTDYFRESVKEVTFSIVYHGAKKEVRYSATTYLVDYNRPLDISTLGGAAPPGAISE